MDVMRSVKKYYKEVKKHHQDKRLKELADFADMQ